MKILDRNDLMTPAQVGAIIGWHPESVRRGLRKGRLRAGVRIGNRWYVKRDEFFGCDGDGDGIAKEACRA